jgi:choline-sulfatase
LGANGLQTAAFIASAVVARGRGLDQGFDQYSAGPAEACSATSPIRRRARDVVDEVLPWLAGHDDSPFFVWMHLYDTHRPYDLPDEHLAAHFDPYHAAVAYEDEQIARVVDHLRRRGLLDSTMIVVAGDHGESLGEHGEESHGMFLYQEALRVPLIMRGPGIAPQRVRAIARLVDVMPTILDMFGVPAPAGDGVSLTGAETRRAVDADLEVYAESTYPRRFGWAPLHSLRADRFKLIDAPRPELYDLEADPGETHNAIAAHPTVAAAMLRRLRSLESGAALPPVASGMDAAVLARIAALGYIGDITPEVSAVAGVRPDPKDRIDVFNRLTRQQWETSARRRPLCQ